MKNFLIKYTRKPPGVATNLSPTSLRQTRDKPETSRGSLRQTRDVSSLSATSSRRLEEVAVVEFGLNAALLAV
jgi:hypothetical protein